VESIWEVCYSEQNALIRRVTASQFINIALGVET